MAARLKEGTAIFDRVRVQVSSDSLPVDILRDASRRLGIAALVMAAVLPACYLADRTLPWTGISDGSSREGIVVGLCVLASLAVFRAARHSRIAPPRLLDLGLGYQVFLCAAVALMENLPDISNPAQVPRGVSWICGIILLFPVLVPSRPVKTLGISLLCAATGPLTLPLACALTGDPRPHLAVAAGLFTPSFVMAVLATVPSFVVAHLSAEVRSARQMGSYHLEKRLGQGGMGEVWRARHSLLLREAAVKLIKPETLQGTSEGSMGNVERRFRREAEVTASLNCPHTVALYDFGQADDGSFYYVMELLDGLDLRALVEQHGPLPAARVTHILRQACESLEEAHRKGMVHRDIKPDNIYLCRLGIAYDFVKVLDFGLVKDKRGDVAQTNLTEAGLIYGTPAYMAPEQCMEQTLDGRSDLYALGCVGYWLLTGETVFEGSTAMHVALNHVQAAPIPPSRRIDRPIPRDLECVLMQCLEKAPANRPQTAAALGEMLAACQEVPPWTQAEARTWWETTPGMALPQEETTSTVGASMAR